MSLSDDSNNDSIKKHSELDLVPTKITAVEPDPALFVTPEKKTFLKLKEASGSKRNTSQKQRFIVQEEDPDLLVTPEKLQSVLKTNQKGLDPRVSGKQLPKNKVRFIIPDSSDETTLESSSPNNTQTTYNESSSLSTEFEDGSSQNTNEDVSDFATKAALYTQRNPLADITIGSNQNFESLTSTETSASLNSADRDWSDHQQNFPKILDMKGKKFTQKQPSHSTVEPPKPETVTKITTSGKTSGHRQKTPAQFKIDKLTHPSKPKVCLQDVAGEAGELGKMSFLKKKSGLHKHLHSVKYITKKQVEEVTPNNLEKPKYNSSLALGQKLQMVSEEKFDAMEALTQKLLVDMNLKKHVGQKSGEGTNMEPEENLYHNLISVDASLADILTHPEFRRIKRPHLPKVKQTDEPNIMDTFPHDLVQERVVLDSSCFSLPNLDTHLVPLNSVMSLYEHSFCWSGL